MVKVSGNIVQLGISGSITQKITAALSSKGVSGSITESGHDNPIGTKPVFVSAAVTNATPTKVVLTFDQDLLTTSVPATTDFTVTDHTVSGVAINGATVELTLSTAVIYFDVLYFTYTKGTNSIKGDLGEIEADSITSTLITNNVAVTGNEIGWWLASDTSTITKDGSNFVSRWNDKLASGRDLLQGVGGAQPLWSANKIIFDGIDNFLKTVAFTWNQPEFIILVIKQKTTTSLDTFFDGNSYPSGLVWQHIIPNISAFAGTANLNTAMPLNSLAIVRVLFNGAGSKIQVNSNAAVTGNAGSANMGGFTLGSNGSPDRFSDIEVQEVIGLKVTPSSDYETSLYNVLKRRAGL